MSSRKQQKLQIDNINNQENAGDMDVGDLTWTNSSVVRVFPHHYIYVRDLTTNVTRLEVGPQTFVRKDNEQVIAQPLKMVSAKQRMVISFISLQKH